MPENITPSPTTLFHYLSKKETLEIITTLYHRNEPELKQSAATEIKNLPTAERRAILEQISLRKKAAQKFSFSSKLLYTKLGLEQSTRECIASIKSERIGNRFPHIIDLCCGIGGESFLLKCPVIGVDRDPITLKTYQFNMRALGRDFCAVKADARYFRAHGEAALIDPARRAVTDSPGWHDDLLSPDFGEIETLMGRYPSMGIKLRPGLDVPDFLAREECHFYGAGDECLDLTVWTGALGSPCHVAVTEALSGESLMLPRSEIPETFGGLDRPPGAYLFEPIKALVRSHLFGYLARQHGLWQIDPRIAYLSGDSLIQSPFLKAYRVLEVLPFNLKKVREIIKHRNIGILEVKKRGVMVVPETLRKELKPKGSNAAVLFVTRVSDRKTLILAENAGAR